MKKKILLLAALLTASMALSACGGSDGDSSLVGDGTDSSVTSESTSENSASDESSTSGESSSSGEASSDEEQVQVTPTFMFFSSKSDADYESTMAAVNELQDAYSDKIKFDLVDIDENPEAKENFPVEGQTPVLIMLNTSNDISAFEFKITDKAKMEDTIKNALGE